MKKIGLILILLVTVVLTGIAQPGGQGMRNMSPEDRAKRETERIGEYVKYTAGQDAKVTALNLKYIQKQSENRPSGDFRNMSDADRDAWRKKMEAIDTEKNGEMKKLLTADQYKQYEAYLKARAERMQQMRRQ